ncbi:respiratory nitrate reductase subunit alpha [Klebsiella variicola]|uniref:Respiratory nitrate reductase subunit alpha n=1 Tax=Klebsiella variicola TaxID=244366 RepID=A0A7H4MMG1_KLEVA|nr:respiratory nitrate reductase subunit alpha [Klebsiella variicola]
MSKFLDRFRYFKQKGETFADGHGQLLNTNRTGRMDTVNVGSMTKLCVPLTVSTAPAHAAGRFM